jgi:hypothetical protein
MYTRRLHVARRVSRRSRQNRAAARPRARTQQGPAGAGASTHQTLEAAHALEAARKRQFTGGAPLGRVELTPPSIFFSPSPQK